VQLAEEKAKKQPRSPRRMRRPSGCRKAVGLEVKTLRRSIARRAEGIAMPLSGPTVRQPVGSVSGVERHHPKESW